MQRKMGTLFQKIGLFFLLLLKYTWQNEIHHSMSVEELKQIFHVDNHAAVPNYEVIHIRSREKRATDGIHTRLVHLNAFGKERFLRLNPNHHLALDVPIYFADSEGQGRSVKLSAPQQNPDIGTPYQDESSMTAVIIKHHPDTGALLMDGTIGEDLVVRPLPASLAKLVVQKPTSYDESQREKEVSANSVFDDELFLNDIEDLRDEVVFSDGLPLMPGDESVKASNIMGIVSKNKTEVKKELPEGLLLLRKKRSTTQGAHIIYKRTAPVVDSDYAMMDIDKVPLKPHARHKRVKREAPYVIYPEILVLVDYDGYLLHGQDNSKIKSYYVSFWNGVDLRYKLLRNPRVKISIAGIIISRSRDAMPYLEKNRVGRDAIDSANALTDMGKYLYQERRLPTYDIAVAITKLDMCRTAFSGGVCNRGTAGFAYVGGACVVNKRLEKVNSVAIVEDTGGFSGIIVAAHEVGHLLGAVHDGSGPPSYLGGPGAKHCRWKDGYIMSDLRHTERGFRWSPCSTEQFHHFLNGETATCLYNLPHEDESLPRILPGKLLSLDAQCRKDRGTSACFKDDRVCAQLFCFDKSSGYCVSYRPAAEGSDCGDGKICLNGQCVYDDDNSISDIDIHRKVDNFLPDSTLSNSLHTQPTETTEPTSSSTTTLPPSSIFATTTISTSTTTTSTTTTTTNTTPTRPSSTTTTPTPTTTYRSPWWKYTNKWKKNKTQRGTSVKVSPPWSSTAYSTTTTSTTTTTTTPPSTTTKVRHPTSFRVKSRPTKKPYNAVVLNNGSNCSDKISSIAGSLDCRKFLKSYGDRYCNHRYIEKNCCKSKRELC